MKRDLALSIAGVTKHQYYHKPSKYPRGRQASEVSLKVNDNDIESHPNGIVIQIIKDIQKDPDTDYGYRKMACALMLLGYLINHKKVPFNARALFAETKAQESGKDLCEIQESIASNAFASN